MEYKGAAINPAPLFNTYKVYIFKGNKYEIN